METLIIIFLAILIANIFVDYVLIKEGKSIDHLKSSISWFIVYATCMTIVIFHYEDVTLVELFELVLIWPFIRWIFHDMGLNLIRGLPLSYLGTTAKTDIFLRKMEEKGLHQLCIKWIPLLIVIITISILFK